MSKKWFVVAVLLSTMLMSTAVEAAKWEIDKAHSNFKFKVKHLMVANVWGGFNSYDATIEYDPKNPTKGSVDITIEVASIDTDNDKRDEHLRSGDFFDVESFPTMTFKSKKVVREGKGLKIIGDLTIRDITREVAFKVDGPSEPISFMDGTKIAASATTTINRTDYGLNWNHALETGGVLVSEEVDIIVDLELNEVK